MRDSHREDEEDGGAGYLLMDIDKAQVLQESKALFKKVPIQGRKCSFAMIKLAYLLSRGDKFTPTEASDVFFNSLNLFVSKDVKLRRLLFILMKELSPDVEQAFMACNSLFQDMSSNIRTYRAPAIRVLRKITDEDASLFGQLDRHLKQSVVDQDPSVASAALVAGLHLSNENTDMVKRWASEMQSALKSNNHMVQYHAIALMLKLRHSDLLAISKLIFSVLTNVKSPLADSLIIRYAARTLREENNREGERTKQILKHLNDCLTFKSDMVALDVCRIMIDAEHLIPKDYTQCITALQKFLMSNKPVLRLSSVKLLSKLADRFPILVALCNSQLDELLENDRCSRDLRTLVITLLLKTGDEAMIERLVAQIDGFMGGLSDDYKVTIISAMKALVIKYPRRVNAVMTFFNASLRDEGGYPFKRAVAEGIMELMTEIPECREQGMSNLCEFIEDCEFSLLLQQVLHFIGEMGPSMPKPARYVRFVYNRLLLEGSPVRASAVLTLATFAAHCPDLRQSIMVILRRAVYDNDDEVRDRAVFYMKVIESGDDHLIRSMILEELPMNISSLEKSLLHYLQRGEFQKQFDVAAVAEQEKEDENARKQAEAAEAVAFAVASVSTPSTADYGAFPSDVADTSISSSSPGAATDYASLFATIPQLADLGAPQKSSWPTALTDTDDAYVVRCIKHIFTDKVAFQFNCTNNVPDISLENVVVQMVVDDLEGLEEEFSVQVAALPYGATETAFVVMNRSSEMPVGKSKNSLHFEKREVDVDDLDEDAEEDDFDLDDLKLRIVDYLRSKVNLNVDSFKEEWEQSGQENEAMHSAEIPSKETLQRTIDNIIAVNSLAPLNDKTVSEGKSAHILYFVTETIATSTMEAERALLVVKFTKKQDTVVLQVAVRCASPTLREQLVTALIP